MGTNNKRLLFSVTIKDCRVDHFTCGGKGGSGKDTSNNGSRVTHEPSGAVGECREERHQHVNTQRAFRRMVETDAFKSWHRLTTARLLGAPSIDKQVEALVEKQYLKVESRDERGRWVEIE
jgi:hypothetical protein